jgi:hypothetical protein
MKKIFTLIIASLFAITIANAQNGWVDHKGDERISVKFPVEPTEVVPGTFAAHDKDSVAYVFTIVDFVKVAGIDSTVLNPIKNTTQFTDQLKVGISQSLPNVTLDDFKIGTWKGFSTYSTTGTDLKKRKYDMWMVLIGNKMYSLTSVRGDTANTQGRDNFFNSLKLTN